MNSLVSIFNLLSNTKKTWFVFVLSLLFSCSSWKRTEPLDIVLQYDFFDHTTNYDSIVDYWSKSEFVDSLKIIGFPIKRNRMVFEIDTVAVKRYGISFKEISTKVRWASKKSIDQITQTKLINENGAEVPLVAVSKVRNIWDYHEPNIFLPKPTDFYHKGTKAIKIQVYTKKKRVTARTMTGKIKNYIDSIGSSRLQFEILCQTCGNTQN